MDILGTIGWRTKVDTEGVRPDLLRVEREVEASTNRISRMEGYAQAGIKMREFDKDAAELRAQIAALERQKIRIEARIDEKGLAAKELRDLERQLDSTNKSLKSQRVSLKENRAEYGRTSVAARKLRDQQEGIATSSGRAALAHSKENVEVERLRSRYVQLASEYRRLTTLREKAFRDPTERQSLRRTGAEMHDLQNRIRSLGGDFEDIDRHVARDIGSFTSLARNIGNTRVHVGFLSTTLRGLVVGSLALSPIITGLVGALGSLVAVLGSGLIGGAGVGAAALTAFGLSAGGAYLAVKPFAKQLTGVISLTNKYADQVAKYGKNSNEAKTALENMNQSLKQQPPQVQRAAKAIAELRGRWTELTKGARAPFFNLVANGIEAATRLMPTFAQRSVQAVSVASRASEEFFNRLSGPRAQHALDTLMGNFNRSIPSLTSGLSKLGLAVGEIFGSFSRWFPRIANGFDKWASGILGVTGKTGQLNDRVDEFMRSAERLVELLAAVGRLTLHFFEAGDNSGRSFLRTMTAAVNRWDEFVSSAKGKNEIDNFFRKSIDTTKRLWGVLSNLTSAFLDLSEAMRPVTNAFLSILRVAARFINILQNIDIAGVKPFHALMTVLGALMGARFLGGLITRIPILGSMLTGLAAKTTMTTVATEGMAAEGAAATGLMGGPWLAAIVGLGAAFVILSQHTSSINDKIAKSKEIMREASHEADQLATATDNLFDSRQGVSRITDKVNALEDKLNALRRQGKQNTDEYKATEKNLTGARNKQADALDRNAKAERAYRQQRQSTLAKAKEGIDEAKKAVDQYKAQILASRGASRSVLAASKPLNQSLLHQTDAWKNLQAQVRRYRVIQAQVAIDQLNLQRRTQGSAKIAQVAARQYANLQRVVGKTTAHKIGVQVDDTQALQQIGRLSTRLDQAGKGDIVKNVLVHASGDDQAINILRRLNQVTLKEQRLRIAESGGAHVLQTLARITGVRLPDKTQRTGERGSSAVMGAMARIAGTILSPKTLNIFGNISSAMIAYQALSALPDIVRYLIVKTRREGATGGAFAAGGVPDTSRMADTAPTRQNRPGRFNRPTLLVGEERRPEYVIATNPAYRSMNELYLQMAAGDLGYSVVPAFRRGGRNAPRRGRARPRSNQRKPKPNRGGPTVGAPTPTQEDAGTGVRAYDYWESMAQHWADEYSGERSQEELFLDPEATGIPALNYGLLTGFLNNELQAYDNVKAALSSMISAGIDTRTTTKKSANKYNDQRIGNLEAALATAKAKNNSAQKRAADAKKDAKNHPRSDKLQREADKAEAEAQRTKDNVSTAAQRLKDAKQARKDRVNQANSEINALNQQIGDWVRERDIQVPDIQEGIRREREALIAQSQGKINAVPADSGAGGAGGTGTTPGMEAVTANAARLELFRQMGSNTILTGAFGAGAAGTIRGIAAAAGAAVGSRAYNPSGPTNVYGAAGGPTYPSPGSVGPSGAGGMDRVSIVNNFAAPPPDPHTWSQQQAFEVGAV